MNEYTVEIFSESYSSYDIKADNSDLAVMEAMSNFLKENDMNQCYLLKLIKIILKKKKMRNKYLIFSKQ